MEGRIKEEIIQKMETDYYRFILFIFLSFLPSFFWLFCYYFYFPHRTTPKFVLGVLFFLGMGSAGLGFFIHQNIILLFPESVSNIFQSYLSGSASFSLFGALVVFLFMLFLVAPIEEFLKFLAIKTVVGKKTEHFDQIVDGIKFGIVTGLGFAVVENAVYFSSSFFGGESAFFLKLFITRFLISTLAHSLYTGIMGYYIGLARLYRMHRGYLLRKGFFTAVIMHGVFNFFLLVNLGLFSVGILIVLLWFMIKWGRDRENLEFFINRKQYQNISPPIFSEKKELESFLFRNKIKYNIIKKMNLCPFCFRKKEPGQDICPHCGMKFPV